MRADDPLFLAVFLSLRILLDPTVSLERRRQEVFYLRTLYQQWTATHPPTPPLVSVHCFADPSDINRAALRMADSICVALRHDQHGQYGTPSNCPH